MSRERRLLEGDAPAIVAKAAQLVGEVPGARDFELSYEAADRVLEDGEEPRDDEAIYWRATATVRRKYAKGTKPITRTYYGTAIVAPGGNHAQGMTDAVVELLRAVGYNVSQLGGPE